MNRVLRAGALAAATVLVALSVTGLVLSFTSDVTEDGFTPVSLFVYLCGPIVFAVIGGALALRVPRHWAGWTLLVAATGTGVDAAAKAVLEHHEQGERWTVALVPRAAWVDNWTWTLAFGSILFTVLKFASGTPYGRRLRAVGWAGMAIFGAILCGCVIASTNPDFHNVATIVDVGVTRPQLAQAVGVGVLAGFVCLGCAGIALVIHYRHSDGGERAQLRWILWAFTTGIAVLLTGPMVSGILHVLGTTAPLLVNAQDLLSQLTVFVLPLALYISVTRYGLFEIDRVVSRTVTYAFVVVVLGICYATIAALASRLVPQRWGSVPVAAATLAVVALFVPLRRAITPVIDRRFHRSRYDAEQVVAAFAEQVRRGAAEHLTGSDLVAAVQATLQPSHASVWLAPTAGGAR